jgi:putative peptidoglycan lipid II flippase
LLLIAVLVAAALMLNLRFGGTERTADTTILPADEQAILPGDPLPTADPATDLDTADPPVGVGTIAGVAAYDPDGDGVENDELAQLAIDGDPESAWRSLCYSSKFLGGKGGVGLVVSFESPTQAALTVDVDTAPYQVSFYATDAETAPATIEQWGAKLGSTEFDDTPGTIVSAVPAFAATHLLVLVNELGVDTGCTAENPYRVALDGIAVSS